MSGHHFSPDEATKLLRTPDYARQIKYLNISTLVRRLNGISNTINIVIFDAGREFVELSQIKDFLDAHPDEMENVDIKRSLYGFSAILHGAALNDTWCEMFDS